MTVRLPVGQTLTWNQAAIDALGTVSDVKLGKLLGINSHTVQAKRAMVASFALSLESPAQLLHKLPADYWDTYMRDSDHELETHKYIESNPSKAVLVLDPKTWLWSSARFRDEFGVLKL